MTVHLLFVLSMVLITCHFARILWTYVLHVLFKHLCILCMCNKICNFLSNKLPLLKEDYSNSPGKEGVLKGQAPMPLGKKFVIY